MYAEPPIDPPLLGPVAAIRIFCEDLDAARIFYTDDLQLAEMSTTADLLVYDVGAADLIVELAQAGNDEEVEDVGAGRFTGFSFRVQDAGAVCETLAARGVKIVGEPARQAWGGTLAHIADPSDNVLTLVQYPESD